MRCRSVFSSLSITFVMAALVSTTAAQVAPQGFTFEQVLFPPFGGAPIGFAFLPDERVIVIEKQSGIVRVKAVGATMSVAKLTIPDVVGTSEENGLLGVAVDPAWPARPHVYFYYNHTGAHCYLTMYTCTGDLTNPSSTNLVFASPYHILTDVPDNNIVHQAGTLRFGPDGMLYVSQGDDSNPCAAQDLSILGGKILRLDISSMPGAGTGPPPKADITPIDNPFPGPDDNARLVYAWGLRNPFRFTIDPANGDLFIGDVGAMSFEELDRVEIGGENFGWPQLEALEPWDGCPACSTCGVGNTFTDPIHYYPHDGPIHSIIGGPRYRQVPGGEANFPAEYDGSVFFIRHFEGFIRRLVETPEGWEIAPPVPGQPSALNWAEGVLYFSDFQVGTDGALYMMKVYADGPISERGLWRIGPSAASGAELIASATKAELIAVPNPASAPAGTELRWSGFRLRSLRVFDAAGREVRTLGVHATESGGTLHWDGRRSDGSPVPAGVYFFRAQKMGGGEVATKVSLVR
jgi:glucose/arabinose dehydrogenase